MQCFPAAKKCVGESEPVVQPSKLLPKSFKWIIAFVAFLGSVNS